MPVNVLVADDSSFFRHRIEEILTYDPNIKVIGTACNGVEAVELNKTLKPDVITMDYEMPLMDGISAVEEIMKTDPTGIVMLSSLTFEGARVTLNALEAGAADFLTKNFDSIAQNGSEAAQALRDKVTSVAGRRGLIGSKVAASVRTSQEDMLRKIAEAAKNVASTPIRKVCGGAKPKVILIGASTGGPVAVQNVVRDLPGHFPIPIVIVQHMPAAFTPAFAERLDRTCNVTVKEAEDGDALRSGSVLIAPGGKQVIFSGQTVKVIESDPRFQYKPSVDVTFGSAAKIFKGHVLGIVMTGMGSDGCEGAKLLKKNGASIWSQDEDSCVVYGMPQAVVQANAVDEVIKLEDLTARLIQEAQ